MQGHNAKTADGSGERPDWMVDGGGPSLLRCLPGVHTLEQQVTASSTAMQTLETDGRRCAGTKVL